MDTLKKQILQKIAARPAEAGSCHFDPGEFPGYSDAQVQASAWELKQEGLIRGQRQGASDDIVVLGLTPAGRARWKVKLTHYPLSSPARSGADDAAARFARCRSASRSRHGLHCRRPAPRGLPHVRQPPRSRMACLRRV